MEKLKAFLQKIITHLFVRFSGSIETMVGQFSAESKSIDKQNGGSAVL